jgi:TPR repeat protein
VPQLPSEAARWFESAAMQGVTAAQVNIAVFYMQGTARSV